MTKKETARLAAAEVIANHIGYDVAEMSDYRYQSTRYSNPAIYAIGDSYYSAPSNGKLHKGWNWTLVEVFRGRAVYRAGTEIVDE